MNIEALEDELDELRAEAELNRARQREVKAEIRAAQKAAERTSKPPGLKEVVRQIVAESDGLRSKEIQVRAIERIPYSCMTPLRVRVGVILNELQKAGAVQRRPNGTWAARRV